MKVIVSIITLLTVSGCAQITYNLTINGDSNKITCTGAVDKKTNDLMDLAGCAYGSAVTNGAKQ